MLIPISGNAILALATFGETGPVVCITVCCAAAFDLRTARTSTSLFDSRGCGFVEFEPLTCEDEQSIFCINPLAHWLGDAPLRR